jgi:hypothetical protein
MKEVKLIHLLVLLSLVLLLSACNQTVEVGDGSVGSVCNIDDDCNLPTEYALKSNCPYEIRCQDKACTVICPLDDGQDSLLFGKKDAIEIVTQEIENSIEYVAFNGRDINIIDVQELSCKDCFDIQASYMIETPDGQSLDTITMKIKIVDQKISEMIEE